MSETKLRIRLFGDFALRGQAKHVGQITESRRQTLREMARLMYESDGIGLAAPQVGIQEAMIVVDAGNGLYKLINPKIVKREGKQVLEEGCLSVPGICIKVKRARDVKVIAQDEFGKPITIEAKDLLACVFQHEIDHLKGKLIVDYASFFEKIKIKKELEALKRKARNEPRPSYIEKSNNISEGGALLRKEGRGEKLPESEAKSCQLQL